MEKLAYIFLATSTLFLLSCGGGTTKTEDQPKEEAKAESHEGHDHGDMAASEGMPQLPVPEGAKVFFANLEDGQTITSPYLIEFGVEGMEVEPAGEQNEGKGHHHIIIDANSIDKGTIVPADEKNIHFGKGQTNFEITLEPGEHTLTLQFADGFHQSYGEQLSATTKVNVE